MAEEKVNQKDSEEIEIEDGDAEVAEKAKTEADETPKTSENSEKEAQEAKEKPVEDAPEDKKETSDQSDEEKSDDSKKSQGDDKEDKETEDKQNSPKEDAKLAAVTEQLIRLRADFDNYKKRTVKEKADIAAYTTEELLKKLLPVIDNLERAQEAADKADESDEQVVEGVKMVFKELMNVLEDEGLKEIDALGKPFDPNYHHGVAVANDPDKDDQVVLNVFQKGYMYKDKVIRAAMVQINQK